MAESYKLRMFANDMALEVEDAISTLKVIADLCVIRRYIFLVDDEIIRAAASERIEAVSKFKYLGVTLSA